MSSINFVSAGSLEEARKTRKAEWDKAYENHENPPPMEEEVPYDPRTLYERLQEQRQKKSDAHAEATKFGNLIHKIDNDEFDFLSTLEQEEAKKKREMAEQEAEELKKFRMNVQLKTAAAAPPLLDTDGEPATKPAFFTPLTSVPKKKASLFAGLVAKPNSPSSPATTITTRVTTESTTAATTGSSQAKDVKAVGKRKLDESDSKEAVEDPQAKKTKAAETVTDTGSKPKGLVGLVTYDSSSDEEDD